MPRLRVAALHGNAFNGSLPPHWAHEGVMQGLEELYLQVGWLID